MKKYLSSGFPHFLLFGICLFYLINNYIWLKLNVYAHGPDEFSHLFFGQNFYNAISSGSMPRLFELFKASTDTIWPPLLHFTAALLCFISGAPAVSSLIINLVCLWVLLFSVYSIGYRLYGRPTAVLAVLLLSLYPMVFRYSRFFGLDFAQLAVLSLSIHLLMRTEYFSHRKMSVLFGLSIGLGLLIKWAFILFLAGPMACSIIYAVFFRKNSGSDLNNIWRNFFSSLFIGGAIASLWYLPSQLAVNIRFKMFLRSVSHYPFSHVSANKVAAVFVPDKFVGYFRLLVNEQVSFLFFLVLIISIPFFLKRRFNRLFIASWYILPYALLSLSFQKEGRFMLSSLPAIALISAAGLQEMFSYYKTRYALKHVFLALLLFLGTLQFFDISYNYGRRDKTFPFRTPAGIMHVLTCPVSEQHGWATYGPPFRKNWQFDKIACSIAEDCRDGRYAHANILVGLMGEDEHVKQVFDFPKTLDYYLALESPGSSFAVINFLPVPRQNDWSFIRELDDLNYFVFVSGRKDWPEFGDLALALGKFRSRSASLRKLRKALYNTQRRYDFKNAFEKLNDFLETQKSSFSLIDTIPLPDGYSAYVYSREGTKAQSADKTDGL